MINIEQIKEYIKCPQFGDLEYGKWGALRLEQRVAYKELIEEIERLHSIIKEVREYIEKEYVQVENKEYNLSWNNLEYIIKEILEILDKVGDSSNE